MQDGLFKAINRITIVQSERLEAFEPNQKLKKS